jgi:hypothetical protein
MTEPRRTGRASRCYPVKRAYGWADLLPTSLAKLVIVFLLTVTRFLESRTAAFAWIASPTFSSPVYRL